MVAPRVLLLLPNPPQRTSYSHVRTALHPTLDSVIQHLGRGCEVDSLAALDIALPVTRMREAARSHCEFISEVNQLVFNIYRLLATILEGLSQALSARFKVDARIMLIRDEVDLETEEALYSLIVATYEGLIRSTVSWTHLFSVDSEQGDAAYQKFYAAAMTSAVNKFTHANLCRYVERVAGGIQMYIPGPYSNSFDSPPGEAEEAEEAGTDALSNILAVSRNEESDQAKISVTRFVVNMALLPIPAQQSGDQLEQGRLQAGSLGVELASNVKLRAVDVVESSAPWLGANAAWAIRP